MRVLDLFSGIGGFALASHWMGWETAAFVEINPFCQKVLNKNFPGVPVYSDIKKFNYEEERDKVGTIDLVCGGFPCQPFSLAGKRKGNEDGRALWGEMFRVIRDVKPAWVVGENVANFANVGLDAACLNLEDEGYKVQSFIIPACAVNAFHRRDRIWILAHSESSKCESTGVSRERRSGFTNSFDSTGKLEKPLSEPTICRGDDGLSLRMDKNRLKAIGNSVVPQLVYEIFKAIDSQ